MFTCIAKNLFLTLINALLEKASITIFLIRDVDYKDNSTRIPKTMLNIRFY